MVENENIDFFQISLNIRKGKYKCLGSGSGRIVFDLDNGSVVKVAKNRKGNAQNLAEYNIGLSDSTGMFAKVSGISENYALLIMEKAYRINSISYVWKYFNVRSNYELFRTRELQNISKKNSLELRDFGRPANWGQIDGKPVIIDFGFTSEVCRKYYMPLGRNFLRRLICRHN